MPVACAAIVSTVGGTIYDLRHGAYIPMGGCADIVSTLPEKECGWSNHIPLFRRTMHDPGRPLAKIPEGQARNAVGAPPRPLPASPLLNRDNGRRSVPVEGAVSFCSCVRRWHRALGIFATGPLHVSRWGKSATDYAQKDKGLERQLRDPARPTRFCGLWTVWKGFFAYKHWSAAPGCVKYIILASKELERHPRRSFYARAHIHHAHKQRNLALPAVATIKKKWGNQQVWFRNRAL